MKCLGLVTFLHVIYFCVIIRWNLSDPVFIATGPGAQEGTRESHCKYLPVFCFFFSLSNERAMLREAVVVEGPPQQGWEGGGAVLPPPTGRMTWRALVGEGNAPG